MMASDNTVRDFPDLKFVDHYERKIQSPEKEMISPAKEVLNPFREISDDLSNSLQKSADESGLKNETIERESSSSTDIDDDDDIDVKEGKTEESDLDSGLDSSDNVSAENEINEKFVDRQEDIVHAEKPETLKSPTKTLEPSQSTSRIVDELFNFIDDENIEGLDDQVENVEQKVTDDVSDPNGGGYVDWSLDAVNNNSEDIVKVQTEELRSEPDTEMGFILTAKTEPTPKIVEDNVHLVPDTPGDSDMNLYWYSTNLELDPSEIQEFKNAQEVEGESRIPNSTGDEYYREKLEDYKPPPAEAENIPQNEDRQSNLEVDSVNSERWSPIYESASSRFLDLASELKTQPDEGKASENVDTETKTSEHPWGLEVESKLLLDSESKHEELPVVEPKFHPIADISHDTQHDSQPDSSVNMKVSFQVRKNVDLKQFDLNLASGNPREISEMNIDLKNDKTENTVDEADATGYIELNDKGLIKAQEADTIEAAPNGDLTLEVKKKESADTETQEISQKEIHIDQPDATGFMEIADREKIKAQFESTMHAQLSEKDVKNVDNMKKKSGDKIFTEEFEKGDLGGLQSEKQDVMEREMSEQDAGGDTVDLNELEANIITDDSKLLEGERDDRGEDETDAVNQEMKLELSQKVESEIQKSDSLDLQVEKAKAIIVRYEPVEIKRKFKVGEDSEKIIASKGGQLLRTETFVDQYFDDSCYSLTLNDNWLRKRNETFEMKTSCEADSGEKVIVNEKMIVQSLQKMVHQKSQETIPKTLSELIIDLDLSEFTTFQTTRHYYELGDCTIALDLTDFGFQSGDVTITVDSPTKVPEAIHRMDKLARDLGKL